MRVGEAPTCAMSPLTAIAARAVAALPVEVPFELRRAHGGARTRAAVGIAAATAGMAASAFWIGITSDHLPHRVATSAYSAYLVLAFMLIGLYWWLRRPASRFGGLLMAFGVAAWVYSWESSDTPLLFDLAVFSEGPLGPLGILENGIGGAAIGVPLYAMAGGYAGDPIASTTALSRAFDRVVAETKVSVSA